jgi:hypothetical protein
VRYVLIAPMILASTSLAADSTLGELPTGALSTSEIRGVSAEICRDHLFDPALAPIKLPAGYRLRTAEEVAASDPSMATLLEVNPSAKGFAVGSLCLMSFDTFIIDNESFGKPREMDAAFWWAAADGPRHADMRGKQSYVQIGSWYSKNIGHAMQIRRTDPMAQFTDVDVKRLSPDTWHLTLRLPAETIEADIRATSPSRARNSGGPGYMTVPMSGESAQYFSVMTYAGHRIRDVEGDWRATGHGVFTEAFTIPKEATALGTIFEDGWVALAGLYRFAPASLP